MSKRPRVNLPSATDLLQPARVTREAVHKDGHDFAPMVLFAPRNSRPMMAVLDDDEGEPLEEMVARLLVDMRLRLGPAEWIAVTTDAYVKMTPEPLEIERGDLGRAFDAGDPEVIEQMVVVLKVRNEPAQMATQTYRYIPSEGWEWDDPEEITDSGGPVIDLLNHYM